MTTTTASAELPSPSETAILGSVHRGSGNRTTRRLLRAGVSAGPVFLVLVVFQMLAVPWFDLTAQPISALNLGDLGWLQKANWIVTGLLVVLSSIGLRRVLRPGPASARGTWLICVFGVGLAGAGIFDVDPGGGAPAGAPAEFPTEYSWHMAAHNLSSMLAFGALTIAMLVFVRRFRRAGRRGWAVYSVLTGLVSITMFLWPDTAGVSLRLAFASVLMFAWLAAVCVLLLRESRGRIGHATAA